jgi:hypothetical protein
MTPRSEPEKHRCAMHLVASLRARTGGTLCCYELVGRKLSTARLPRLHFCASLQLRCQVVSDVVLGGNRRGTTVEEAAFGQDVKMRLRKKA